MADFEKVYSVRFKTDKAHRALSKLQKKLEKIELSTREIGRTFDRIVGGRAVKATGKLDRKMAALGKTTNAAKRKLKKLGTEGSKSVNKVSKSALRARVNISKIGGAMQSISRKLTTHVVLPLAAAGVASLKFAIHMNRNMANVSTLLTGGLGQINALKKGVQDLAIETGQSTTDLADGLYEVVSALGESTKNMDQLKIATRSAIGGRSTTKESVKLLSAVTKGYGDTSAEAMAKVSDLALFTVKLGQTTYPELAASMGRVIPLAAAMNTSQEELFGTMATLTGVTGDTAEVSTQLSSIYSAFLKPTEKMTEAAQEYGFETGASMLKTVGLRQSLINLNEAVDGNEEDLAKLLKRKEGLVGALALLGGQSDVYTDKLEQMRNAIGATDEAYRRQTEGINKAGHTWDQTKQRMVVFAQRMGDRLIPVMWKVLDAIEPILKKFEALTDEDFDDIIAAVTTFAKGFIALQAAMAAVKISTFISNLVPLQAQLASTGAAGGGKMVGGIMGKLNAAGPLIAAAIAGWGIGTMIWNQVKHGMDKAEAKARGAEHKGIKTTFGAKDMTRSQLESEKKRLERQRSKQKAQLTSATPGVSFADKQRQLKVTEEALAATNQSLGTVDRKRQEAQQKKYGGGPEYSDEFQMQSMAASGAGGGGTTNNVGPTTINVNGAKGPKATAREVNREMDKRFKQGGSRQGAAEQ